MSLESLATAAALGADARPPAALPDAVAAALPPEAGAAGRLLGAAAAVALARRAALPAGPATPLDLPAPTRPEAPATFVALLRRVQAAGASPGSLDERVLADALARAAERGLTLPAPVLLELADALDRPAWSRRQFAALLDERGWALLGLNSAWATWLAAVDPAREARAAADPALWAEGTLKQRVAHLAAVRAADPAAGRALVEGLTWAKETAEARERFVAALRPGLSLADEPFLEAALADRARAVREAAAHQLGRLPGSALLGRAEALARHHVARRKRLLRPPLLVATGVPGTERTARDAYPDDQPDGPEPGRLRLQEVIRRVPTDRWPALVGATAAELAAGPAEVDGAEIDLRGAWAAAAGRWGDAALARAILDSGYDEAISLAALLPPGERAAHIRRLLKRGAPEYHRVEPLLGGPLDPALADVLLEIVDDWTRLKGPGPWQLTLLAACLGAEVELASAPRVAARLQAAAERMSPQFRTGRRALGEAAAALQLRGALADALAPYPVLQPAPDQEGRP